MRALLGLIVVMGALAHCGETPNPAPAKPGLKLNRKVDKAAAEMDYGPVFAGNVGLSPTNTAYKGLVIHLNKEKTANVCFDTELMRVAGVWTGGWLALAGRPYADNNNDFPLIDGMLRYDGSVAPGWAIFKDGTPVADDPRPNGDGPLPREWAKYKGLYLHGERVVLEYSVGSARVLESFGSETNAEGLFFTRTLNIGPHSEEIGLLIGSQAATTGEATRAEPNPWWSGLKAEPHPHVDARSGEKRWYLRLPPSTQRQRFALGLRATPSTSTVQPSFEAEDLEPLTKGGPARWAQTIETKGELNTTPAVAGIPYTVDTLTAPLENPYKAWLRFTALDFFPDGRAALCTWNGDVWICSGLDEKLEKLTWRRFATGLAGPMGLKIVDGVIHVADRSQITKLHDLNGDGEADYYENFNNDCFLTTNFHEYCFDLQTDRDGNFYFAKGAAIWAGSLRMTAHAGTVCKVSKDGTKFETIGSGLRAPNGISIGPGGEIISSDNQGNWVPLCPLNLIEPGKYYGFVGHGQKALPEREPPICWIPHSWDKSTASQIWVETDKWGPFKGHLFAVSYDCSISKVFLERAGGRLQGGVFKLPLPFPSGLMRARFHPQDGQLYACGLRGWSSRASKEQVFARVRYTGGAVHMPIEVKTKKGALEITFTGALDKESCSDAQNVGAEWYVVKRTGGYGSPEFKVSDKEKKGREPVEIKAVSLLGDGKTVRLEIPELKPVDSILLSFNIKAADGTALDRKIAYTIHAIGE